MIFYTVFFQMLSFYIMIGVGYIIGKKQMMDKHTNQQVSQMIVNVFNPILSISSAIGSIGLIPIAMMAKVGGIAVIMFAIFILLGFLLTPFFAKNETQKKIYRMMFVFSNLGFIGIPVVSNVLGHEYVVYVTEFMMVYTIVLYTHGMMVLEGRFSFKSLKKMINPGVISGIIAILIILFEIELPEFIRSACLSLGNVASPLALVAVGYTVSQSDLKKIFSRPKLYIFSVLKLLVIPLLLLPLLKICPIDDNAIAVCMILCGMPVGNLPLMLLNEKGIDGTECSHMIILSTALCALSIPFLLLLI